MNTSQIIHGNSNNGTSMPLSQAINEINANIVALQNNVVTINDIEVFVPAGATVASFADAINAAKIPNV